MQRVYKTPKYYIKYIVTFLRKVLVYDYGDINTVNYGLEYWRDNRVQRKDFKYIAISENPGRRGIFYIYGFDGAIPSRSQISQIILILIIFK